MRNLVSSLGRRQPSLDLQPIHDHIASCAGLSVLLFDSKIENDRVVTSVSFYLLGDQPPRGQARLKSDRRTFLSFTRLAVNTSPVPTTSPVPVVQSCLVLR